MRYLRIFRKCYGEDYLKVQDEIYKDMSLDEIYERASSNWQQANLK